MQFFSFIQEVNIELFKSVGMPPELTVFNNNQFISNVRKHGIWHVPTYPFAYVNMVDTQPS